MSVEVLCTRCMTRFDGLDQFTVHCRAIPPCRRRADRRNRRPRRRGVVVSEESIRPTTQRDLS